MPILLSLQLPAYKLLVLSQTIIPERLKSVVADMGESVVEDVASIPTSEDRSQLGDTEAPVELADDFDVEMLQARGDDEPEAIEFGDELHTVIAARLHQILVSGLKKESKEKLTKKYLYPKNVPFTKALTLNPEIEAMLPEIEAMLPETYRLRDKRLLNKQNQLGRALSALGKAMTSLLKKNPDISDDMGKLIADSHYAETDTQRSIIIPLVDKSLAEPFKNLKGIVFCSAEA